MDITTIIILVVVGLAVVTAFIVFVKAQKRGISLADQKFVKREWNRVITDLEKNPNAAILEADKLLAHVLKLRGYQGSVGEMLKQSGSLFKNLDNVWSAHKLRNQIAHEMGLKVEYKRARSVIGIFKDALKDLGITL